MGAKYTAFCLPTAAKAHGASPLPPGHSPPAPAPWAQRCQRPHPTPASLGAPHFSFQPVCHRENPPNPPEKMVLFWESVTRSFSLCPPRAARAQLVLRGGAGRGSERLCPISLLVDLALFAFPGRGRLSKQRMLGPRRRPRSSPLSRRRAALPAAHHEAAAACPGAGPARPSPCC